MSKQKINKNFIRKNFTLTSSPLPNVSLKETFFSKIFAWMRSYKVFAPSSFFGWKNLLIAASSSGLIFCKKLFHKYT